MSLWIKNTEKEIPIPLDHSISSEENDSSSKEKLHKNETNKMSLQIEPSKGKNRKLNWYFT